MNYNQSNEPKGFRGVLNNFESLRRAVTDNAEPPAALELLLAEVDRMAAETGHVFDAKIVPLTFKIDRGNQQAARALALRYFDADQQKFFISVYVAHHPGLHEAVVNGFNLMQCLSDGTNHLVIAKMFNIDFAEESLPISFATLIVEPFNVDYSDRYRAWRTVVHLARAATNTAEMHKLGDIPDPKSVLAMLPDFYEGGRNGHEFKIDYAFNEAPLTDLFDQPIRNDITLKVVYAANRRQNMSANTAVNNDPAALTISGYVDFRYTPEPVDASRPWVSETPRYVPEFIITDIGYDIENAALLLIPAIATFATSLFMHSGQWVESFRPHYNQVSPRNLDRLQRTVDPIASPPATSFEATLNKMIGYGYMVSFDILTNPTTYFDGALWASAGAGHRELQVKIIEYFGLSMTGDEKIGAEALRQCLSDLGRLFPEPVPVGRFIDDRPGSEGMSNYDSREVDFLYILNHANMSVADANEYQDAMFGSGYNQRGPWGADPSGLRLRFRRFQDAATAQTVTYSNSAHRLVIEAGFIAALHMVAGNSPMRFSLMNNKPSRPVLGYNFITRPA